MPLVIAPAAGAGVIGLALFWLPALLLALPMVCWLLATLGAGMVLGLRQRCAYSAAAGLAAATMHFGWSLGYLTEVFRRMPVTGLPRPLVFEEEDGVVVSGPPQVVVPEIVAVA